MPFGCRSCFVLCILFCWDRDVVGMCVWCDVLPPDGSVPLRYQRGCRLLSDNLKMDNACSLPPPSQHLPPDPVAGGDGDDEDIDVPEDVEEVVGQCCLSGEVWRGVFVMVVT